MTDMENRFLGNKKKKHVYPGFTPLGKVLPAIWSQWYAFQLHSEEQLTAI